jgi:hypoxanthine phosphoribosyltransferase
MDYTQFKFNSDIQNLINQIKDSGKQYDKIVAIQRGGLILGVCLSHTLDIPLETLKWSTRDYVDTDIFNLTMRSEDRILLVDDICDTGKTLETILDTFPKTDIDTAVLIHNVNLKFTPTYYAFNLDRNLHTEYIDFWWESYK